MTIVLYACGDATSPTAMSRTLALVGHADPGAGDQTSALRFRRVLLISVDGLHQLDLERFVAAHPQSTLARLSGSGITYSNASASRPSDSFPGLLAMVTGGTPRTTGVFYDDSYDRSLSPPGSHCATVGTEVVYDESIDRNPDALDAGGGISPAALPLDPAHGCRPVYPHSYLRVNTVFEVIKAAGLRTAWSDKHPAYDLVRGPSGRGVDDLFTPEIAANGDYTTDVPRAESYDDIKVRAILNEIDGKDHSGTRAVGVPAIFGMNFQAVSVGQKTAGYANAAGSPSAALENALAHTDRSLGRIVRRLEERGLLSSTLIVISAKHGQSPIDRNQRRIVDKSLFSTIVDGVKPGLLAQVTADDIALLWLTDQRRTFAAVQALRTQQSVLGIHYELFDASLDGLFRGPRVDSRTPDIIAIADLGVIYTKPTSTKLAEHGGFSDEDVHVPILLAASGFGHRVVRTSVQTTQIAPTIVEALGLDPQRLEAVREEGTDVLPGLREEAHAAAVANAR